MNRIKRTAEDVWSGYCWECDRSRVDEALALLGGLVAGLGGAVTAWYVLCALTSAAGCGTSLLGVPVLCVARAAWKKRGR